MLEWMTFYERILGPISRGTSVVGGWSSKCPSRKYVVGECLFSSKTELWSREELCEIFYPIDP